MTDRKGQQQDDTHPQGGQHGDDVGRRRGAQAADPGDRLDVTNARGDGGNRQEGNKDKKRGGGTEKQQQLRNKGQEGGKTGRSDNE